MSEGPPDAGAGTDGWDPDQYARFAAERRQPFVDLLALCRPVPGGTVVDLGCGPGERTVELHERLGAARTVGIDNSPAMLGAARRAGAGTPGLTFAEGDLAAFHGLDGAAGSVDVIVASASLHWVGDHPRLLARLRSALAPGGQLAFQVPANFGHLSHVLAAQVAAEPAFAAALRGRAPEDRGRSVLAPAHYAEILFELGAVGQRTRLEIYGHVLEDSDQVVEWVKGTLLTPYRAALDPATYEAFLARYRQVLSEAIGDRAPYFYAFPRILAWATF